MATHCKLQHVRLGQFLVITPATHALSLLDPIPARTVQVQDYIAKGGDVNKPDREDCSPLMWACWGGHVEIVKRLLDEGAK